MTGKQSQTVSMDIDALVTSLQRYNEAYRAGDPLVSDETYDRSVERLRQLDPGHPFLHAVEPEAFKSRTEIRHPNPMLSTEKAYTREALEKFLTRVRKSAGEIGVTDVSFIVTPKLDGLAGRDDGVVFATRGNGEVGYEISSAFDKGIVPKGGRGLGLGEIVIVQSYFDQYLATEFEHPRNMAVGIVSSDTLNDFAAKALEDGMVHFLPYTVLPTWEGSGDALLADFDDITAGLVAETDYPLDGIVVSVVNGDVKNHMGATAHHYRWQIAVKTKGETAITVVEGIRWQVGRTGNVTPVLEIQPVALSGAKIKRVTAHNAGLVRGKGIGVGAEIEIIRSGEVIPKLERVVRPSSDVALPTRCPVCEADLEWEKDFLRCTNPTCMAKIVQRIRHWFKTLGNADWFGIKTIERLVEGNYNSIEKIYAMEETAFVALGFGPVQSKNLVEAIHISRYKSVADWRFLAAFGIPNLGRAECRKLLSHIALEALHRQTAEGIETINGFGAITSGAIVEGLASIQSTMDHMIGIGFNLEKTVPLDQADDPDNPIFGKGIVFSGKMKDGTREEMQIEARRFGAKVQTAVSSKTDYLVCGENVGANKIRKAQGVGAKIIPETEYRELVDRSGT